MIAALIASLEDAQQAGSLQHRTKTLIFPWSLVVDEIGYLPVARTGAMLCFQLMAKRYEHASTVLASNKSFAESVEIVGDDVMAAALIDRVVHHCHVVNVRGSSYAPLSRARRRVGGPQAGGWRGAASAILPPISNAEELQAS